MIKDVFAPVVKTLFIPEGNPGVQEVKEIRAVPRVIQADGDAQEITVSGEMDLSISYIPINDTDDEIPWRTIQFTEEDDLGRRENEEQVIARLESALKEDQGEEDEEGKREDQWFRIDISVPFTLAIDTDGFWRDHIVKIDPCVYSSNWFLVGPKAIEFEAVLQLASQEEAEKTEIKGEEPKIMQMEELTREECSREEDFREEEHIEQGFRVEEQKEQKEQKEEIMEQQEPGVAQQAAQQETIKQQKSLKQQDSIEKQELIEKESGDQSLKQEERKCTEHLCPQEVIPIPVLSQVQDQKPLTCFKEEEKPKIKPKIPSVSKPMDKSEIKIREEKYRILVEKEYFQMKFYRVQLGEDLDAIADKFGIPRERISTHNSINEEEIRTGLLLSIPRS